MRGSSSPTSIRSVVFASSTRFLEQPDKQEAVLNNRASAEVEILPSFDVELQRLMRHRIDQRVDAERVAETREPVEVRAVFAFALEGVAVVRIVRDEHHQMPFVVKDRAGVWLPAVDAALRGSAGAEPEVDRRNLRHTLHFLQRVEDLVRRGDVDDGILVGWEDLPDLRLEHAPSVFAPEVVDPQKPALEQIIA